MELAELSIQIVEKLSMTELGDFFEQAFNDLPEGELFAEEDNQSLVDWFAIERLSDYLRSDGKVIAARDKLGALVGAAVVGKHNPLTWPDGKKAEIVIMAVRSDMRNVGLGKRLLEESLSVAKEMGAKKVLVNTHVLLAPTIRFYEKNGFIRMGVLTDYYDNGDAVFLGMTIK